MKRLAVFVVLAVALLFFGCDDGSGNYPTNPFVGTWVRVNEYGDANTITFNANMSFVYTYETYSPEYNSTSYGTYTVSGNTAILTYTGDWAGYKYGTILSDSSLYICYPFAKKGGGGTSTNPLAGTTWAYEQDYSIETFTFNADMSFVDAYTDDDDPEYSSTYTGTYAVSGNTVIMQYEDGAGMDCIISGNTLFAIFSEPYTKQ